MENEKEKKNVGAIVGKVILIPVTVIIGLVLILTVILGIIVKGNSVSARDAFVTTFLETGQLKFVPKLFLSADEIQHIVDANKMQNIDVDIDSDLIHIDIQKPPQVIEITQSGTGGFSGSTSENLQLRDDDGDGIIIVPINGRTFYATMMIILDPSRVSVSTIYNPDQYAGGWPKEGLELDKIVKNSGALAAINGGLYNNSDNSGGVPYGVVVEKGKIIRNRPNEARGLVMIGITEDNILTIDNLFDANGVAVTAAQVEELISTKKIRDAVCFQEESSDKNNHFVPLIVNGVPREVKGAAGSGLNPRTAIGQRADGSILMLVTDGRGTSGHVGASASDLIEVMKEYGAVNAANLDGGSSSCMYFKEGYLMDSVTFYYKNSSWKLPLAWVVD